MISLDLKSETTSSSPLSLTSSKDEPSIDFSKLLKGMKLDKKGVPTVQNGTLVLSLEGIDKDTKTLKDTTKNTTLLALLKNNKPEPEQTKEPLEINPKLTNLLGGKELKTLVLDAKNYLKTKILQSDNYKELQIKELPKTLKGLVDLAKKTGVDISKITLQEIQPKEKIKHNEAKLKKDFVSTKEGLQSKKTILPTDKTKTKEIDTTKVIKAQPRAHENKTQLPKEIKNIPIFKPQILAEHTTQQLVEVKQSKVEHKTQKDRADETLKLLLRGERVSEQTQNLTADFSVQSAKVIAPKATTQVFRDLESLLHNKNDVGKDERADSFKTEQISVHKADSFEVKLNEAKQMIKYLSQDVKTAIEDYKSPFTRVKVQLNPQRLGEIDLTVVQRGKNLHVSLTSNSNAINTLSMNATELKTQLSNNGINNATLSFSSGSQNGENASHQQKHQSNKEAQEEYNYLQNEQNSEEIISSLEIVLPRYI